MTLHHGFGLAARAARRAYEDACASNDRASLEAAVGMGADGTPTMRIDQLVEDAVVAALDGVGVNILSEEVGFVDNASVCTFVIDPLDGSANAAAGVPISCFSAAMAVDGQFVQALTVWLETGRRWAASTSEPVPWRTTGCAAVEESAVSLLRPHERNRDSWWAVAERASRVRILSCSTLESMLVAQGSIDAFADAGSDTHRLVDLAAALVAVPAAGGRVIDVFGRPIELDVDLTRRWSGVVAATSGLAEEIAGLVASRSVSSLPT